MRSQSKTVRLQSLDQKLDARRLYFLSLSVIGEGQLAPPRRYSNKIAQGKPPNGRVGVGRTGRRRRIQRHGAIRRAKPICVETVRSSIDPLDRPQIEIPAGVKAAVAGNAWTKRFCRGEPTRV